MNRATHMDRPCHADEWVMTHVTTSDSFKCDDEEYPDDGAAMHPQQWLAHQMCDVTHMNESRMSDAFKCEGYFPPTPMTMLQYPRTILQYARSSGWHI